MNMRELRAKVLKAMGGRVSDKQVTDILDILFGRGHGLFEDELHQTGVAKIPNLVVLSVRTRKARWYGVPGSKQKVWRESQNVVSAKPKKRLSESL